MLLVHLIHAFVQFIHILSNLSGCFRRLSSPHCRRAYWASWAGGFWQTESKEKLSSHHSPQEDWSGQEFIFSGSYLSTITSGKWESIFQTTKQVTLFVYCANIYIFDCFVGIPTSCNKFFWTLNFHNWSRQRKIRQKYHI